MACNETLNATIEMVKTCVHTSTYSPPSFLPPNLYSQRRHLKGS